MSSLVLHMHALASARLGEIQTVQAAGRGDVTCVWMDDVMQGVRRLCCHAEGMQGS